MLCIVFVTMLLETVDDSFTSTMCLYLSPSQLCLIKRKSNFKVKCMLRAGVMLCFCNYVTRHDTEY